MMQTIATQLDFPSARDAERNRGFRRLSPRRLLILVVVVASGTVASAIASTVAYLRLPEPTGAFAVGKVDTVLVDEARLEPATAVEGDHRRLRVVAWYPAVGGTGTPAGYLSDLAAISDGLVASGEVGSFEVAGLGLVADPARSGAEPAPTDAPNPVVLLSPGNATNVELYGSLAEELASHGYVVIGIDHPYQVAAVSLEGDVAIYSGDPPMSEASQVIPARIDERVADIRFVLDRLEADAAGLPGLAAMLDLTRVGVMGHSNGGVAAAQACEDARVDACLNIDGQLAGGPFSSRADLDAPEKPFLYLTKETELHPALEALFEEGGLGTFRVVIPEAAHDQFADVAMFRPRLIPLTGIADDVITVARGFSLAFFDHALRGLPRDVFSGLNAPTDVQVYVYPLVRPQ